MSRGRVVTGSSFIFKYFSTDEALSISGRKNQAGKQGIVVFSADIDAVTVNENMHSFQ